MHTYSTSEVSAMTGMSYRMLDHWVRSGVIRPLVVGSGRDYMDRRWDDDDVAAVRVLVALAEHGYAMKVAELPPLVEAARCGLLAGARWFGWDGNDWSLHDDASTAAAWVMAQSRPVLLVDLVAVSERDREKVVVAC